VRWADCERYLETGRGRKREREALKRLKSPPGRSYCSSQFSDHSHSPT